MVFASQESFHNEAVAGAFEWGSQNGAVKRAKKPREVRAVIDWNDVDGLGNSYKTSPVAENIDHHARNNDHSRADEGNSPQ